MDQQHYLLNQINVDNIGIRDLLDCEILLIAGGEVVGSGDHTP